jgi:hypothetical protein
MTDTLTLPYLDLAELDIAGLTLATDDQRWRAVRGLLDAENVTVPDAWSTGPLQAWCYLVLAVNNIERDDDQPRPLTHYGIDLGFSSEAVHRFVWFLA